jgi:hypothetical protein
MDLHTVIEQRGDILLVTVSGHFAFDVALRLFKQACEIAAGKQVHKILFDCLGVEGKISGLDRYQFGVEMAAYLKPQTNMRLAFVGQLPLMDGFAALVAQNRGLTIEVLPSQHQALNWLERWPS